MKMTELFLAELDREVERSRRALEQVPEGKHDWKPHEKSMMFGYLTEMVATIPTWITMIIKQDELDVAPKGGPQFKRTPKDTERGVHRGARQVRCRRTRGAEGHDRRAPEDPLAPARRRSGRAGRAALRDDSRHDQSLGAPSRPDDRVPSPDGCKRAGAVRPVRRRQTVLTLRKRTTRDGQGLFIAHCALCIVHSVSVQMLTCGSPPSRRSSATLGTRLKRRGPAAPGLITRREPERSTTARCVWPKTMMSAA